MIHERYFFFKWIWLLMGVGCLMWKLSSFSSIPFYISPLCTQTPSELRET